MTDAMKHHIRAAIFCDQINTRNVNERIAKLSNAHSSRTPVWFALLSLLMCKAFQHIRPETLAKMPNVTVAPNLLNHP